jgi:hypothetical protein
MPRYKSRGKDPLPSELPIQGRYTPGLPGFRSVRSSLWFGKNRIANRYPWIKIRYAVYATGLYTILGQWVSAQLKWFRKRFFWITINIIWIETSVILVCV